MLNSAQFNQGHVLGSARPRDRSNELSEHSRVVPFRWGIVGTGEVSRKFALGLGVVPGAELAWIASRDAGRAGAFARRVGAAAGHGNLGEALRSGIDAVYIATPATVHAEQAIACLSAGVPVLVEKPFATSGADAAAIAGAARAAGVFCMEALWTRFHPALAAARDLLKAAEIGEPRALRAEFCIANRAEGSIFDPALGGGALLQRGVYPLSLAAHLLGMPERATAEVRRGPTGVDEDVAITLHHPGGAISQIRASLRINGANGLEIAGDEGAFAFDGSVFRPHGLRVRRWSPRGTEGSGRLGNLREHPAAQRLNQWFGSLRGSRWVRRRAPYAGNGYGHQAAEVMARVRAGDKESPLMPLDESVALVALMERLLNEGGAA